MTAQEAKSIMEGLVQAAWTGAGNDAANIAWRNTDFTPPADDATSWIRVDFIEANSVRQAIGQRGSGQALNQMRGVLSVDIYTAKSGGAGDEYTTADVIRAALNRVTAGSGAILLDVPTWPKALESDVDAWERANISVSFSVDESA